MLEYGLGVPEYHRHIIGKHVLILIVLEYGLGGMSSSPLWQNSIKVLILIVLEYGLGVVIKPLVMIV